MTKTAKAEDISALAESIVQSERICDKINKNVLKDAKTKLQALLEKELSRAEKLKMLKPSQHPSSMLRKLVSMKTD